LPKVFIHRIYGNNRTPMNENQGKLIFAIGILICLIGVVWYFAGDKLQFLGKLPGDIRVEKENFKFYFPLTTMILVSVLVNVIVRLYKYFFS
jgi:hypothetical protein